MKISRGLFLGFCIAGIAVSAILFFHPPPSSRYAVIGDFGVDTLASGEVASLVHRLEPDLVLTVGDNNCPEGGADTIDPNVGQYYHDFIFPYSGVYGEGSTVNRFYPTLGNHDWKRENISPYLEYFSLPGNERYYEFIQGPVHFFALDSEEYEPDGSTATSRQADWLQERLAAAKEPWKIVYFHDPPYSSCTQHGSTRSMQWLFAEWGATAVISGHDHGYERLQIDGIPYFVNGLGGDHIYQFADPLPESQVRYNSDHGAMLVTATDRSISFQMYSVAGTLIDEYSLDS